MLKNEEILLFLVCGRVFARLPYTNNSIIPIYISSGKYCFSIVYFCLHPPPPSVILLTASSSPVRLPDTTKQFDLLLLWYTIYFVFGERSTGLHVRPYPRYTTTWLPVFFLNDIVFSMCIIFTRRVLVRRGRLRFTSNKYMLFLEKMFFSQSSRAFTYRKNKGQKKAEKNTEKCWTFEVRRKRVQIW